MKESLKQIFYNHSYLNDETILKELLEKTDENTLERIKDIEQLRKFLYDLNKEIELPHILNRLFLLESNMSILNLALNDTEKEHFMELKKLNEQNLQIIKEVFIMLENKEINESGI